MGICKSPARDRERRGSAAKHYGEFKGILGKLPLADTDIRNRLGRLKCPSFNQLVPCNHEDKAMTFPPKAPQKEPCEKILRDSKGASPIFKGSAQPYPG